MTFSRGLLSTGCAVALVALAGCMSGGPNQPPMSAAPTGAAEGEWLSADGVAVSRFSGGVFQTLATDTGNKLSEGSYRYASQTLVEITGTSLIRQTPISFNCAVVSAAQMNCTSASGQQFVLTRRAAV
jgi:hypothetical protein